VARRRPDGFGHELPYRKNITGFARNADWSDDNNNGTNKIPGLTPSQFDHATRAVRDDYPPQATAAMMNLIDSHDVNRVLFVLTELGEHVLHGSQAAVEAGSAVPVHVYRSSHSVVRR